MKNSFTIIAFITAVALHLIIGGILLMNVDFSLPKEKPKEAIINASLVNQKLFDDLAQRKKDKLLAEQRKKEQIRKEKERIKREEALRKKKEAQRIKDEKAAKEKAVKEKAAKEKAVKEKAAKEKAAKEKAAKAKAAKEKAAKEKAAKAKAAKEKAAKEKAAKEKAAKEKAAKEKAAKEKAAKEKAAKEKAAKEKAAKEKAAKAAAEKERLRQAELEKLMEMEFEDEFSSAQSSKQLSEIARYKALIQDKISRNWQLDNNMKGKTCTLAIRLASDGLILSVKASRGDAKLCESAKRAALKAKTLPIPKDPNISPQFRDFDITLDPNL